MAQGGGDGPRIREAMAAYRPLTHSAVSTLLARLQEKGLVGAAKGTGRQGVFVPCHGPSRAARGGGWWATSWNASSAATHWRSSRPSLKRGPPSTQELDRLEKLLDQLRSNSARRTPCRS